MFVTHNAGKIGRILFGLPFIAYGIFHFLNLEQMQYVVPSFLPFAKFWVVITGIVFLAAGLATVFGTHVRLALQLLALQLFVFLIFVHLPKGMDDSVSSLRNIAFIGAALYIAAQYKNDLS